MKQLSKKIMLQPTDLRRSSERANAASKAEDARPAFAFDLLGTEPKRGDAAIHRQAVARRRAVKWRRHAEDFSPPFAERDGKSALPAELDIRQRPRPHIVDFVW